MKIVTGIINIVSLLIISVVATTNDENLLSHLNTIKNDPVYTTVVEAKIADLESAITYLLEHKK